MSELSDQQVDDRFRALMEGLRTTIPGVMVLFGFLLTVPLSASFDAVTGPEGIAYYVAFAAAGMASILLIAPSIHQRVRVPISGIPRQTRSHVHVAAYLATAGSVAAAVAIAAVSYLVTSLLFGAAVAIWVSAGVGVVTAWSWFWLPLVTFGKGSGR